MFRPGQLCKIITIFEDTKIPVQVYLGDYPPNEFAAWSTENTFCLIDHGTIGMCLSESLSNITEIEDIQVLEDDLKFSEIKIPIIQILFIKSGLSQKGWVMKDNIQLL